MLNNNCVYNPSGVNYDGLSAGPGDIALDPLFVNRAAGEYHLQRLSPCIDVGLDSAAAGAVDMDGQPRLMGAHVDIGADEFPAPLDATSPTTPVVTDDGAATTSATQLHASWTSTDPESGIAE